ncbi:MAG: flavin reductase family protein [Oscillospiraceae bacterium]|nr:flavin reductase family protein [Oscillospiraceae bacterium]
MNSIPIGQAQRLTAPAPFALLSVRKEDGSDNLMAVSWWTYLSNHPPMLGVCLSKKGLSGSLIERSGFFTLSVVGEALADAALACGRCSGREHDKAAEFGVPLESASAVPASLVSGSRAAFECRLVGQTEAGDHVFYLAEILACRGDAAVKQLFAWDGYSRLGTV